MWVNTQRSVNRLPSSSPIVPGSRFAMTDRARSTASSYRCRSAAYWRGFQPDPVAASGGARATEEAAGEGVLGGEKFTCGCTEVGVPDGIGSVLGSEQHSTPYELSRE